MWCRTSSYPILLVAANGDELVGSVSLIGSDLPHHPVWATRGPWLSGLYVIPDRRGQGIATSLIAACEAHARSSGVRTLLLYTTTARTLYERAGWRVVGSVDYDGNSSVVMIKNLSLE